AEIRIPTKNRFIAQLLCRFIITGEREACRARNEPAQPIYVIDIVGCPCCPRKVKARLYVLYSSPRSASRPWHALALRTARKLGHVPAAAKGLYQKDARSQPACQDIDLQTLGLQ